jgi:Plasmid encoded RepA protein
LGDHRDAAELSDEEIDLSDKPRWPATIAHKVADELIAQLQPRCEQACAAGSLRRGKAEVGDIEILYVPRIGQVHMPGELFPRSGSLADELIEHWLAKHVIRKRPNVNGTATWGAQNKLAVHVASSVPVDLFATTSERWFVSLVVRTGSKEMNTMLATSALRRGMQLRLWSAGNEGHRRTAYPEVGARGIRTARRTVSGTGTAIGQGGGRKLMGKLLEAFEAARRGLAPINEIVTKVAPAAALNTPAPMRSADDQSELCFQHSVFCQTGLPYRDPTPTRLWVRKQGRVILEIEAGRIPDPHTGRYTDAVLPWGTKARLLLAYINGEALRQHSPDIEVDRTLSAFVRRICHHRPSGRDLKTFNEQLSNLAVAIIRIAEFRENESVGINDHIVHAVHVWSEKTNRLRPAWTSRLRLSQEYFASLQEHAVPLSEAALAALANNAMALDIYSWLAQRLHRVDPKRPAFISWVSLKDQFGQGYKRMNQFKRPFRKTVEMVLGQYQDALVELNDGGMIARHSLPPVAKRLIAVR